MDKLTIARINHLFEQLRPAVSSSLLGITVATALFWQQTGSPFFILWAGFAMAVAAARYLLYRRYTATTTKQDYRRWLLVCRTLSASHALLWAVLALASLHYGGTPSLSSALIILTGVCAAAGATSAADLTTFYVFSAIVLAPITVVSLVSNNVNQMWLGIMSGAFLFIMAQLARTYNRTFSEALRVRFENEALSERLIGEKQLLAQAKEQAEQLAAQLYELSAHDGLTGLYNRRAFDEALARHVAQPHATVSLLLCDIDAFKSYNDHYGHLQGDTCLKEVAAAFLSVVTRPSDMVARYGGEEFGVILADTDEAGAAVVARRLCEAIRRLGLPHVASPVAPFITVSFGVASTSTESLASARALIDQADQALYQAKARGRDQVVVARLEGLAESVN